YLYVLRRHSRRPPLPPLSPSPPLFRSPLEELADVYREADARYAGYRCEATTECCRFGLTGREPYVTSIELLAVKRAIAARGGPLSPRRRALPLAPNGPHRPCPPPDAHGRCSIYASRPLGCRTCWCHRATSGAKVSQRALNDLVARIKAIAARHGPGGEHGRLLTRAL